LTSGCTPNAQVQLRASQIKASEASNPKIARQLQRTLGSWRAAAGQAHA
jgi:hypothetical protein